MNSEGICSGRNEGICLKGGRGLVRDMLALLGIKYYRFLGAGGSL